MVWDWKKIKNKIKDHLRRSFLLTVRDEETFEETASYKISLKNIYILLSGVVVAVGILLFLLIITTPLKRFIPGYGDVRSQSEFVKLQKQLVALEEEVNARNLYIESFQRILSGNPETSQDVIKNIKIAQEQADPVPKIKEDSLLRIEYEAASKSKTNPKSNQRNPISIQTSSDFSINQNLDFFMPVRGTLAEGFKPEKNHYGIDLLAAKNTPVNAALSGSVIQSDWTLENGYTIAIQHEQNFLSFYKHNSVLLKKVGSYVKTGEVIAIIGNTGELSDAPHIHFELWQNGKPVNPLNFIRLN